MAAEESWDPNHPAVWVERDSANQNRIVMLRHPNRPYVREFKGSGLPWKELATDYCKLLHDGWPDFAGRGWLPGLWEGHKAGDRMDVVLRWLPLSRTGGGAEPRHSAIVERNNHGRREVSLVLLGCLALQERDGRLHALYGGEGIRVIAHVGHDPGDAESGTIRFTSFATTLPPYSRIRRGLFGPAGFSVTLDSLAGLVASAFGMANNGSRGFGELGIRLGNGYSADGTFEVLAKTLPDGAAATYGAALCYGLVATIKDGASTPAARYPLTAFADLDAEVFTSDPMTSGGPGKFLDYRPNRSWRTLDTAQEAVRIGNLLVGKNGGVQLADVNSCYKVVNSSFADEDEGLSNEEAKEVSSPVAEHSRTNLFAAATACYHVDDLFQRMSGFGISPNDYFRFASLPLTIRYRAGIIPGAGHDGRTINAQALWLSKAMTDDGLLVPGQLEARFALADLQSCPELSPLGVVTDQRWCWHEFSHVLISAATGELEYRFAHSSGDAMGAILSDPYSALATDMEWRSVSFPWVSLPARRHDRKAREGWSWCGSLYGKERTYAYGLCDRRGYWSEQMLSTTLFNIYRSLGGDTGLGSPEGTSTANIRAAASDYTLCLIMQANRFLGPAAVTPVKTPDGFATALISADIAIGTFDSHTTTRCGGSAHKVIRWAFENQGLYQLGSAIDAPGAPPPVDIFIDDQRDPINGTASNQATSPRGGYDPVPLDTTKWYAADSALWVLPKPGGGGSAGTAFPNLKHHVYARVGNRGQLMAPGASVAVWAAPVVGGALPPWPDKAWNQLQGPSKPTDIPAGTARTFGPFKWTPPKAMKYALVAIAGCADDPSNADPATNLPCATSPGRTDYLVACDNNMGLRIFDIL